MRVDAFMLLFLQLRANFGDGAAGARFGKDKGAFKSAQSFQGKLLPQA